MTYVRGSGAITGAIGTIAASKGHPVERSISRTRGALITNVTTIPPALEESLAEAERLISHRNRIINPERSGEASRFAIIILHPGDTDFLRLSVKRAWMIRDNCECFNGKYGYVILEIPGGGK